MGEVLAEMKTDRRPKLNKGAHLPIKTKLEGQACLSGRILYVCHVS